MYYYYIHGLYIAHVLSSVRAVERNLEFRPYARVNYLSHTSLPPWLSCVSANHLTGLPWITREWLCGGGHGLPGTPLDANFALWNDRGLKKFTLSS